MDEAAERPQPSMPWLKNNLVALGSAAVFTVYSAGYFRTRDAAERFAGESVQRRAAVALSPDVRVQPPAPRTDASATHETPAPVIRPSSSAKPGVPATVAKAAPADSVRAPAAVAEQPAPAAPTPVPTPAAPVVAAPVAPTPVATATATAPSVDSAATAPAKTTEAKLKDGVFSGWGTSRHGDIQASVEIENGKIVGAYISQCRTQYSCSWVSALPGQVVQRQSADVDYVSGATQSSNAFYYGVVEALKKAKAF